jgi:hypothetical protein
MDQFFFFLNLNLLGLSIIGYSLAPEGVDGGGGSTCDWEPNPRRSSTAMDRRGPAVLPHLHRGPSALAPPPPSSIAADANPVRFLAPAFFLPRRRPPPAGDPALAGPGAPPRLRRWQNHHHRQAAAAPNFPSIAAGHGSRPHRSNPGNPKP